MSVLSDRQHKVLSRATAFHISENRNLVWISNIIEKDARISGSQLEFYNKPIFSDKYYLFIFEKNQFLTTYFLSAGLGHMPNQCQKSH